MREWAKKTWVSAAVITVTVVSYPNIPYKEPLAVVGPLVTGTAWHKISGANTETTTGDSDAVE